MIFIQQQKQLLDYYQEKRATEQGKSFCFKQLIALFIRLMYVQDERII